MWVAGLSLSLLIVVGLLAWSALRSDPYVASRPAGSSPRVSPAQASSSLRALEQAIIDRDIAAAEALAPAGDSTTAAALGALVRNADQLDVSDFSLRYVDSSGAVDEDGTWTASVDATWAFDGFDRTAARAEISVSFATEQDRAPIVGVGGGDRVSPLWLAGPVTVRRTPEALVVVAGEGSAVDALADEYLVLAKRAVPVNLKVLPDWRARLVVEAPDSQEQFDRTLGAEPSTYARIAAVTTAPDGVGAPGAPVHVFVNPRIFEGLQQRGQQIVMSHETTHVATDAPASSGVPQWLVEGFADYVALRDVDLPDRVTARQVIEQVRRDGLPRDLPGAAEFDKSTPHLGAAYESAWIACRVLSDRGGERALVGYYEALADGTDPAQALRAGFSWTQPQLLEAWRDRLAHLAA